MRWRFCLLVAMVMAGLSLAASAEQSADKPKSGAAASQPAGDRSADQVMKELNTKLESNPLIEPSRRPASAERTHAGRTTNLDPAVIGAAPGVQATKLRQEGEFIINRKGRLTRSPNGVQTMFVFESDSKSAPEMPVILLPCRMLESMEEMVHDRGESLVFILSGEVTTYHSANYLLPTMMKPAIDKGNLQK